MAHAPFIWRRAAWGLALVLGAMLPFELRQPWLRLGPLVFTNAELLLATALAVWAAGRAAEALASGRTGALGGRALAAVRGAARGAALPAALWLGWVGVSALAAPAFQAEALKFTGRLAAGVLAGVMAWDLARTAGRVARLGAAMALGGLGVGALGVAEAANLGPVRQWLTAFREFPTEVGPLLRVSASLPYANIAAMFLELTLPLALAWALTTPRALVRWLLAGGMALGLAALVLTLSRAGLATLALALILLAAGAHLRRAEAGPRRARAGAAVMLAALAVAACAAALSQPRVGGRLNLQSEADWYRAALDAPAEVALDPGEQARVPVTIHNLSTVTWPAVGPHAVSVSYRLGGADGRELPGETPRTPLPGDLAPGQSVEALVNVNAPSAAGVYSAAWDLVEENVTWFSAKAGAMGATILYVGGATAGEAPPVVQPPLQPSRGLLWRLALRMAWERPLTGVGPDNYRHLYGDYAGAAVWNDTVHANSLYLEWLATLGVPGALAYGWLAVRLARRGAWAAAAGDKTEGAQAIWSLALAASLAAWFVHGLLDYFHAFGPTNVAFWMLAGLALRAWPNKAEGTS